MSIERDQGELTRGRGHPLVCTLSPKDPIFFNSSPKNRPFHSMTPNFKNLSPTHTPYFVQQLRQILQMLAKCEFASTERPPFST